ncbi:MAG TPA: protein kinase, partial [Gemmataceae bacterium]|nr:protein kinase [Gemmataceae bacterium]
MAGQASAGSEIIPGYTLVERVGAGGFGEVWKVTAPGGLSKAVKLVFGQIGEARAEQEFKALSRIKEVRHPFLLSLERFEIVDSQLIIVTELADASLMDRFKECRDQGLPGIPRDELLAYLRDAADALDY